MSQTVLAILNVTMDSTSITDEPVTFNTTMPETGSSTVYQQLSISLAWITLALCIFGMIGNVLSIVIYASPTMRSPINELLLGTSLIDFMLSLLSIPTFVIPGMAIYYGTRALHLMMIYCAAYIYPLTLMMQSASIWAFVVITIERYQAVCRPFARHWSTIQRSRIAIAAVCALAIAYNAIRFFEFRITYINGTVENETLVDVSKLLRDDRYYMNYYYIGLFLVTHFIVPFVILVILNAMIIRTICQSRQRRRLLNKKERSEHRTAIMMVIVVLTFICCYTLLFILNILEAATDWFISHIEISYALNDISNVLIVFNAASTIVVYYFFSQKYRALLLSLLGTFCPERCIKYVDVGKAEATSVAGDDLAPIKKKVSECPTQMSPLLSRNVSVNGRSERRQVTTFMNSYLSPQTLDGSQRNLLVKNHVSAFAVSNDIGGIMSDQEEL